MLRPVLSTAHGGNCFFVGNGDVMLTLDAALLCSSRAGSDLSRTYTYYSLLALYPGGIPRREPPSCEAPRQLTIYEILTAVLKLVYTGLVRLNLV